MVAAGHLGVKSAKGFYDYSTGSKDLILADRFKKQTNAILN
jgi:3-hydroxybutyryl-CoA dehydrogenase